MALTEEQKKYIKENHKKSDIKEIALELHVKAWEVGEYIESLKKIRLSPASLLGYVYKYVIPAVIIVILGFVFYGDTLSNTFVYQDHIMISGHEPLIKKPINIFNALGRSLPHSRQGTVFYRPVFTLSLIFDYLRAGPDPKPYHLTNILLHISCGIILYLLMFFITDSKTVSAVTSAVYMIHPVNVESAAYISGRADLLLVFFFILSLYFYLRVLKEENPLLKNVYRTISGTSFALSLLCKENALFLVPVIFLYCFIAVKQDQKRKALKEVLLFVLIGAAYVILRSIFLGFGRGSFSPGNLITHFVHTAENFGFYAGLVFSPFNPFLQHRLAALFFQWDMAGYISLAMLAVVLLFGFATRIGFKLISFGLCFFAFGIFAVSHVSPMDSSLGYNMHLPAIGFFIFTGGCLAEVLKKNANSENRSGFLFLLVLYMSYMTYTTYRTKAAWRNEIVLYKWMLKYSESIDVRAILGRAYLSQGMFDSAIEELKTAVSYKPDYYDYYCLGNAYMGKGRLADAAAFYLKSINANAGYPLPHAAMGSIYFKSGDYKKTIQAYAEAMRLEPDKARIYEYHYHIGSAYLKLGMEEEARKLFKKALELNRKYAPAYIGFAQLYERRGLFGEAIIFYDKASKLDPANDVAHAGKGRLHYVLGDFGTAELEYKKAVELRPDSAQYHKELGNVYYAANYFGRAMNEWNTARKIDPKIKIAEDYEAK